MTDQPQALTEEELRAKNLKLGWTIGIFVILLTAFSIFRFTTWLPADVKSHSKLQQQEQAEQSARDAQQHDQSSNSSDAGSPQSPSKEDQDR